MKPGPKLDASKVKAGKWAPAPSGFTDSELAETVACQWMSDGWKWCPELGWLRWDGTVWVSACEADVIEVVRLYLKGLLVQAINGQDVQLVKVAQALQSGAKIAAVAKLTRGQDCIRVRPEDFDADPELLNCGNGVVNLRTGVLLAHSPDFRMRRLTPVYYAPGSGHADWAKALGAVADDETEKWLWQLFGAATTGYVLREDYAPFLHGGGANGKTSLVGAIRCALGGYAALLLPSMLGGQGSGHETQMMALMGARLAYLDELPQGHLLDVAKLKSFTGTAEITGRFLYRDQMSFTPTHVFVAATNYAPVVPDTDLGTWRRLKLIPFPKTFQGTAMDAGLRDRLLNGKAQQEAVLAWLVAGAQAWLAEDRSLPAVPSAVVQATDEWRADNDVIYRFIQSFLASADSSEDCVEMSVLLEMFNNYLPKNQRKWSARLFSERFRDHVGVKEIGGFHGLGKGAQKNRSVMFAIRVKLGAEGEMSTS